MIRVQVAGADRLLSDLAKIAELAGDLRPIWPKLAELWAEREARVFAAAAWAPFASATLVRHQQTGKPPMVASGSLVAAMTSREPRFADEDMAVLGPPKSAKAATSVGARHQRGTVYMPPRKLAPRLTAAERRRIVEAIHEHVTKGL